MRRDVKSHGCRAGLRGFTLVELLVVLVLVAVLATLAVPGLRDLIANQRLAAATQDLAAALAHARSEARSRAQRVDLVPGDGGWQSGWQVRTRGDDATLVLLDHGPMDRGVRLGALGNGLPNGVHYDAFGFARSGTGLVTGCLSLAADSGRRSAIVVSATGRFRVCDPDRKDDCGSGQCNAALASD